MKVRRDKEVGNDTQTLKAERQLHMLKDKDMKNKVSEIQRNISVENRTHVGQMILEIRKYLMGFQYGSLNFIPRQYNSIAQNLAKKVIYANNSMEFFFPPLYVFPGPWPKVKNDSNFRRCISERTVSSLF